MQREIIATVNRIDEALGNEIGVLRKYKGRCGVDQKELH
jgi:hypothetical protein